MQRITKINDEIRKNYKVFKIWVEQREIYITNSICYEWKYVVSNNVGAIVFFSPGQENGLDANPDMIGNYLALRHSTYVLVIARNTEEAIAIVKADYKEGLNIGGERKEKKAQWLSGRVDVLDTMCPCINLHSNGHFICGENGEFGDCWLSGADPVESCKGEWIVDILQTQDTLKQTIA